MKKIILLSFLLFGCEQEVKWATPNEVKECEYLGTWEHWGNTYFRKAYELNADKIVLKDVITKRSGFTKRDHKVKRIAYYKCDVK